MNKRGSVSILVGSMVPVALISGLFAVDAARVWLARTRLQAALDAAALTGARDIGTTADEKTARDVAVKAVLAGNNGKNAAPPIPGQPAVSWTNVRVTEPSRTQIRVEASVEVKSILGGLLPGFGTKTITRHATADRTTTGVELALVVDITLSMVDKDGGSTRRIDAARDAMLKMLSTLFGDKPDKPDENKKWLENVYISVVPFNVTANYGKANAHFLDASQPMPAYSASWSGPTEWGGCMQMRNPALLDANPQDANAGLRRYYWPSTYDRTVAHVPNNNSQSKCRATAAYRDTRSPTLPDYANNVCMGHNDWSAPAYLLTDTNGGKQNNLLKAFQTNWYVTNANLDPWTTAHGPNMMCPPDSQRVLPLTRDRKVVEDHIKGLSNLTFSYGTNVAAGLQAGWFTLSENWRARPGFAGWPSAEPAATGGDPRPELPPLPLNYYTEKMDKVMVVLTDGDNLWLSSKSVQLTSGGSVNTNLLVRPESQGNQGFYGSYGYIESEFPGDFAASNTDDASAKIDTQVQDWCTKIKARLGTNTKDKITLYTIGFGPNVGDAVLRQCASEQDGQRLYYHAPDAATLETVFKQIGNHLSKLRLSQ